MYHHSQSNNQTIENLHSFIQKNIQSQTELNLVLLNHSLFGLFDNSSPEWRQQYYRNSVQQQLITDLARDSKFINKFVVLKGMSFSDYGIYQNLGERLTSDIDLLVDDLSYFSSALEEMHFKLVSNHKWRGNDYKKIYAKMISGVEVIVELHTRIFYHVKSDSLKTQQSLHGYNILKIEDLLLHLVGHLGFQHTFLKLHWLLDIQLLLNQYGETLDWKRFEALLEEYQLINSWKYTCHFLNLVFHDFKPQFFLLNYLISSKFILFPEKEKFRYYILKNFLKDRFSTSFTYNFWWVLEKGWKK